MSRRSQICDPARQLFSSQIALPSGFVHYPPSYRATMEEPRTPATPGRRPAALVFIFITVVLDMLALGIIVPVLPRLVVNFMGGDADRTAQTLFLFGTAWAAMQFFFAPVLGALSDRFGRRPIILLSNLGSGLDYGIMALAPNVAWLFVGRLLSGITTASIPAASAYIADVTAPGKRAAAFGMLGAAFGLGFVIGPGLGGLLGQVDPRLPFWAAGALSLANAAYGFFVLPESLTPEQRKPFAWRRANPVGALVLLRSHPELLGLAAVNFVGFLAHEVFPSVYVVYTIYRFQWDERTIGLTLTTAGICSAIVQAVLTRPAVARLGERGAVLVGTMFGVLGFALYGWAPRGWIFWTAVPLTALWGLGGPAAQAIMSRRVDASEQGRLQGANGSLRGITGMLGPGLFTLMWVLGRAWHLPGAPFFVSSLLLVVALAVALHVTRREDDITAALEPVAPPTYTSEMP